MDVSLFLSLSLEWRLKACFVEGAGVGGAASREVNVADDGLYAGRVVDRLTSVFVVVVGFPPHYSVPTDSSKNFVPVPAWVS